jgi:gamma-glutamylcyclotransferase (GGCT)/AIG2-like uncharacterized protein YtfP
MTNRVKLAVYGTLKSTHRNHSMLGPDVKVLAQDVRLPGASLYELGWFPGMVKDPDGTGVMCEIVEVPAGSLRHIDLYEGYEENGPDHFNLFVRELVTLENGEEVLTYFYNRPLDRSAYLISSGRWEDSKECKEKYDANDDQKVGG